ncbi:hypothetical protein GCM10007332_03400 [Epilithonimonas arachidiradicis]|nr:hypothetical protein GCM10007332_03400 [Epilithonimonas arachidiradicis]
MILFLGHSTLINAQTTEAVLKKADKLMLMNPKQAYQIAEKYYKDNSLNHKDKLHCLFILTNTSNLLQNRLEVIKYGNETLKMADNGDDVITKIKILGILGNTYQFLKLNEKTRIYLDQAELLLASPKIKDSLSLVRGNIFYLKAMNYFYSLDSDIALSYFNKAINEYIDSKNPLAEINIKIAYLNKASCLIQQKRLNEALENLKLASINPKESSQPYPPQFAELQEAFITLGNAKILAAEGKYDLSNELLFKILNSRKNQSARDDIENDIYDLLSKNYLQLKDIEKHDYYEMLFRKQVAQSNIETAKSVNQLISQEKVENDVEKDSINQKYLLLIALSSIFFGVIISILLFKTVKMQKKKLLLKKQVSENI